jgi:hypothetical protein
LPIARGEAIKDLAKSGGVNPPPPTTKGGIMEEKGLALVDRTSVEKDVQAVKTSTTAIVARATNLIVDSPEKNQQASGLVGDVKKAIKLANAARMQRTKPLDELKEWIMGLYAPYLIQLKKAAYILDNKMRDYYIKEQEKARLAEQKRLEREEEIRRAAEELLAKGKEDEAEQTLAEIPPEQPVVQEPQKTTRSIQGHTTTMKKYRTFRITDQNKVPDCFWIISESLIQKAVNEGAVFSPETDGIEVYDDIQVSTRTAK